MLTKLTIRNFKRFEEVVEKLDAVVRVAESAVPGDSEYRSDAVLSSSTKL